MADEAAKETPIPGDSAVAPAAAVTDAAVAAPLAAVASSPEVAPAAAVEAKPEVETPVSQPSLLETADGKPKPEAKVDAKAETKADAKAEPAPAEAKPADAKPEEKKPEVKADEKDAAKATDPVKDATADAQPPAPVKYEAFKVPDGIKLDEKRLEKFTELVGPLQIKQEDAQKMFDLHVQEMNNYAAEVEKNQRKVWDTLNDTWKSDTRKELGNHAETDLSMAKAVVEEYGGSPDQVREYMAHLNNNGMGNYIGHIRLLRNIGKALNVFEDSMVPANPTAPKAEKSPGNRGWYSSMGNGQA